MAHKKGAGSSDNGRDSNPKFLGVKLFGGQSARAGSIIIRQRGTRFHIGDNTYLGRDHTIHAKVDGFVTFSKHRNNKTAVSIKPFGYTEVDEAPVAVKKATAKTAAPKAAAASKAAPASAKSAAPKAEPKKAAAPKIEEVVAAPVAAVEPIVEAVAAVEETPAVVEHVVETVAAPVVEAEKAETVKAKLPKGIKQDDLKIIEGVGPKIESLFHEAGIKTWLEMSNTPVDRLKEILEAAGSRYQMHDPSTWPKQAQFAAEGRFEDLKEWQDLLDGGKTSE